MSTSSTLLFLILTPSVHKPNSWRRTPLSRLILLWISPGPKRQQIIKLRKFHLVPQLRWRVKLRSSHQAPRPRYSFVWMLWHRARHFWAIRLPCLWLKMWCLWKREPLEESLSFIKVWQKKGKTNMFVQSLLNLQKRNLIGRSISIALRPVITGNTAPRHQFRITYTSIPCQLIGSPRMTLKPS